ncbi:MAG: hypothetical protein ACTSWY_14285 [Promethearchaeota archaeon]
MIEETSEEKKGYIKLTFKNQGGFIVGLLLIFYGYFGVICNIIMYYEVGSMSFQFHKNEWAGGYLIIWSYQTYLQTFFIPALILFLVCFYLTYKEDIPYYGVKSSIWLVPITITISIFWYWVVYGISIQPFRLLFANGEGYLSILIIIALNLSGSLSGMKLKQFVISKRERIR